MALIETEGLRRDHHVGGTILRALDAVTLSIERGEFVAIMGPSGSGKSTLLNLLGCLDRPTAGRYRFEGRDVGLLARDERAKLRNGQIGFIFQNFNLLPRATALENVAAPLHYARVPAAARRRSAEERLRAVGLLDRAQHYPNQLSGGQQQRVAIARALVNNPSLLLADEPTGALDTATGRDIMAILQFLSWKHGLTIVLVTHDREIAAYAGRIITFRDGRVITDERSASGPLMRQEPTRDGPLWSA